MALSDWKNHVYEEDMIFPTIGVFKTRALQLAHYVFKNQPPPAAHYNSTYIHIKPRDALKNIHTTRTIDD